ncbi:hypothetical protein GS424_011615 [Eggerthella guodeyinii]|uniref:Sulfatase N-terminal domain-containing protein n=1 Tax=Eggerthella guodeyinii TaxID=2690837 RepID=A0A6L7IWM8_9ACTN|nr:hypothetical protein [Eggerthella guodeyinii]QOS67176.1 hypothetical protein GS424_011615 [Eggerthella guodeyinii]
MLKKRLAITLFDAFAVAALAMYVVLAFAPPAYAYVDPSVMTYAIQAFAGVAVALGAVAGVALRRTRKMLFKVLNIDENARKDVEPEVHRLDASGRPIGGAKVPAHVAEEPARKRAAGRGASSAPKWGGRLAYALIVSVFTVFTVFVVAPFEIVAANASSLVFGLSDTWLTIAVPAVIGAACLALALSALRGKAFQVALLLVFSIGLAAYVQALFLNGGLPTADGRAVPWDDYTTAMVVSGLVWILIIVIPLVLSRWFGPTCRGTAAMVSVCLVIVQAVGVVSLFNNATSIAEASPVSSEGGVRSAAQGERQVTEEGLFEVAPSDNVIVLMLDMVDLRNFDDLLASDPSVKDRLDGFTYFENTTGSLIPTRYAVPYLLSGQLPSHDESFADYIANRYDLGSFLPAISDAGYSIGLYSDSLMLEPEESPKQQKIVDSTLNIHPLGDVHRSASLDAQGALLSLWKCALYRDMPWVLKPPFWFYTDEVNSSMVNWDVDATGGDVPYTMNDFQYFDKLKNIGLSVDNEGYNGAFRFIHLQGSHYPYAMDENGNDIGVDNSTIEKQTAGVFKIVDEYLNQLRDLGVYDDSTVIIMSDHGSWHITEEIDDVSCPIMIVKPAASSPYAFSGPMRTSDVPASHLDFEATVIEAMGMDAANYGTSLFALTDESRTRPYYAMLCEGVNEVAIQEFEIEGNALDFSGWHPTGKQWASG